MRRKAQISCAVTAQLDSANVFASRIVQLLFFLIRNFKLPFKPLRFRIKMKLRSFKSSEHITEKGDGPYHGLGY